MVGGESRKGCARGLKWTASVRRPRAAFLALLVCSPGFITPLPFVAPRPIPAADSAPVPAAASLEERIWQEINVARSHPWVYAEYLEGWRTEFVGTDLIRPGRRLYVLKEGLPAVDEAIRFLRNVAPRPPLALSTGMSQGAEDLVEDLGPVGGLSHVGLDGSEVGDRLSRYGTWLHKAGEVIQCGTADPREIVALLIVDDGTPDRSHRRIVFDADFQVMGAALGGNARFAHMCVITFAEVYLELLSFLPGDGTENGPSE